MSALEYFNDTHQMVRETVRKFVEREILPHVDDWEEAGEFPRELYNKAADAGILSINAPEEFGGTGEDVFMKVAACEELVRCSSGGLCASLGSLDIGLPPIWKWGSDAMKQKVVPEVIGGQKISALAITEPNGGSDVANLRTRAVRDGDHYVVNGQKTWTTLGQHADWIFCLVRTDPNAKKQEGISFLLIDMQTPGITVRPLITLDGEHEVNEVFFDDVKVPVENLVGEENKGWTCAKYLLTFERTGIAGVGQSKAALKHLKEVARKVQQNGKPLIEDPLFRNRLADVEMELMALEMTNLRTVAAAQAGGVPGAESSFLKIMGTELRQEITDLFRRAAGPYAQPFLPESFEADYDGEPVGPEFANTVSTKYFNMRKLSIFGGSNEIQKNIIAKMILGL